MTPKERAETVMLGMSAMLKGQESQGEALEWIAAEIEKDRAVVVEEEREACAKLLEAEAAGFQFFRLGENSSTGLQAIADHCSRIAKLIRARGEKR